MYVVSDRLTDGLARILKYWEFVFKTIASIGYCQWLLNSAVHYNWLFNEIERSSYCNSSSPGLEYSSPFWGWLGGIWAGGVFQYELSHSITKKSNIRGTIN